MFSNDGIILAGDVFEIVDSAIKLAGNVSDLSREVGIEGQTIRYWLLGKVHLISWDKWAKLKPYLVAHGFIRSDDIDFMLPSEMRDMLKSGHGAITAGGDIGIANAPNSIGIGTDRRTRMISDILELEICDSCKVMVLKAINGK